MLGVERYLEQVGGVARGRDLHRHGVDRSTLARLVSRGTIARVRPGIFASLTLDPALHAAAAHGGALTCASVLRLHGIWVLPSVDAPHIWVPSGRRNHAHNSCSCVVHRHRGVAPLGRAPVATALVHLHACAGDEAFFASFESAWRLGAITRRDREHIRAALPQHSRWLVSIARPDADSGLESILRLRFYLLGVQLECQVNIPGVGRGDFVAERVVLIEVDGRDNHDGPSHRHKDLVRDAAASRLGYETLRFDYAQIIHDWPTVRDAVLAAIERAQKRDV